jgi:hypothetical protein
MLLRKSRFLSLRALYQKEHFNNYSVFIELRTLCQKGRARDIQRTNSQSDGFDPLAPLRAPVTLMALVSSNSLN